MAEGIRGTVVRYVERAREEEDWLVPTIIVVGGGALVALNWDRIKGWFEKGKPPELECDTTRACDLQGLGGFSIVHPCKNPKTGRMQWIWPPDVQNETYEHAYETCDELIAYAKTRPVPVKGTYVQSITYSKAPDYNLSYTPWIKLQARGKLFAATGWWKPNVLGYVGNESELWMKVWDETTDVMSDTPRIVGCTKEGQTRAFETGFVQDAMGRFGVATHVQFGSMRGACFLGSDDYRIQSLLAELTVAAV